jgi:hypothetical protein
MPTNATFEVFGFNTSKSPEKHSEEAYYMHSIKINHFKDSDSTEFIANIIELLAPKTIESLEDAKEAIEGFKGSSSYFRDKNAINSSTNNVLNLFDYFSTLSSYPSDIVSQIVTRLGLTSLADILRAEFIAKWDKIWDNLIVDLFSPISMSHRAYLIHAIQTLKIVRAVHDNKVGNLLKLKKMIKAIPVLPEGIVPIHIEDRDSSSGETENLEEIHQAYLDRIDALKVAMLEVVANEKKYRYLASQVNTNVNWETDSEGHPTLTPDLLPELVEVFHLNTARFAELTTESRTQLTDLGLGNDVGRTYEKVKKVVSSEISSLLLKVYNPSFAAKKGVIEGGVMFALDDIFAEPMGPGEVGPIEPFWKPCRVKPLGISDYRKVEAIWSKYEAGEIAHIENLLKGEYKDRETRHLRSSEETYTLETVKENEVIRDLQTTERFALQKEASKIVQNDFEAKLDAYVKGSYGTVSFGISGGISFSQSTTNSQMEASQYAKDVIDRSVNRILERTREERTIKILEEYEEKNTHKLDNVAGSQHVVGVYRWVDKIMHCKLANYGKKLLFEFMVPEPAAFHIFAKSRKSLKGVYVEKPIHPRMGIANPFVAGATIHLNHAHELDITNYKVWASAYGATVESYPEDITIGKAYNNNTSGINNVSGSDNGLKIPDGYYADTSVVIIGRAGGQSWSNTYIQVGNQWYGKGAWGSWIVNQSMNGMIDILPVSWTSYWEDMNAFNVEVHCKATDAKISEWQLSTFKAIMDAYQKKLDDYNNAVSEATVSQGIIIEGDNPLINRETERTELRKWCIQLMTENNFFYQFDAMKHDLESKPEYDNYPYFDNCEAIKEGHVVKFVESILDWGIMSYFFYPYFYGNRNRWVEIYNTSSIDPLHTSFLQAGFARVVVPVRLGFENVAMQFVETGIINYDADTWAASSPEAIDASIELGQNALAQAPPVPGDPDYADWEASDLNPANWPTWEVRLPTNLVILQDSCPVASDTALPVNPNI